MRRNLILANKPIDVHLIPECAPCIMKSLQILVPLLETENEAQMKLFAHAYKRLAEGYAKKIPPVILSIKLYQELYEMGNTYDPYRKLKDQSIAAAEQALPHVEAEIGKYEGYQKLRAALAASIAGNLIDFNTAYHEPELDALNDGFMNIIREGFALDDSQHLWNRITAASGTVAVLGDNAGETLFDIPLLEILHAKGWDIVYVVKARPMINDATREDIKGSRIPDLATIADNGGWAHGVPRQFVSLEFLDTVANSDLVLSKGQANVETFPEIQKELGIETYYIMRAKCPHIANALGANVGDNVIARRPQIM